jgi:hypothetical protein
MKGPPTYLIRLYSNPDLVLAYVDGRVVLNWRDNQDGRQLWHVACLDAAQHTYRFLNFEAGRELTSGGYGVPLRVADEGAPGEVWQLDGSGAFESPNAIRRFNQPGWNFNVLGGGPYDIGRDVGLYRWGNGDPNEVWMISAAETTPNPAGDAYRAIRDGGNSYITARLGDPDPAGHLVNGIILRPDERCEFAKIDWLQGFALRNRENRKFIKWGGANQPLIQTDVMSLDCLWTLGPTSHADYFAIRPLRDSTQNFNLYGAPTGGDGHPIYTWGWGGGYSNERWKFVSVA